MTITRASLQDDLLEGKEKIKGREVKTSSAACTLFSCGKRYSQVENPGKRSPLSIGGGGPNGKQKTETGSRLQ